MAVYIVLTLDVRTIDSCGLHYRQQQQQKNILAQQLAAQKQQQHDLGNVRTELVELDRVVDVLVL